VQVVDVGHVDGVLKHSPVATLKLNLAVHCVGLGGKYVRQGPGALAGEGRDG
jgi:hypothetical protein